MRATIRTAVIPAGGLGSRLMPLTRAVPKELLPVWNKPVLQYAVEEAVAAGIERIVIVTAPGKDSLQRHFANDKLDGACRIDFVIQETARGLGDAIRVAAPRNEDIAVLLPDELLMGGNCLKGLVDCHAQRGGSVLAVQKVPLADVRRYGIVDVVTTDGYGLEVKAMVEKPLPEKAPSQLAIIGRYVLDATVIDRLQDARPTVNNEIQLTDSIAATCGLEPVTAIHYDGERYDCGSFSGLLQANMAVAQLEEPAVVAPFLHAQRSDIHVDAA
ncbi:UTP--glucose-1-phosphate uridylyltransferase [Dongia soli]|uniref:UTP--glucose-1-phosphate uridylyltransferase n=1 Tax=Dongia soli TaxID=600628 RepID=A0ABU5EGW3_9PROT|nr:sugar phosphate nucleotidyltransferase [Dongia soli]MDY0885522.1 sugar phosphate nucleotidyltransferase [Dongia soli]